jgi:hypothetical protein
MEKDIKGLVKPFDRISHPPLPPPFLPDEFSPFLGNNISHLSDDFFCFLFRKVGGEQKARFVGSHSYLLMDFKAPSSSEKEQGAFSLD